MAIDTAERPQQQGNNTGTASLSPAVERQVQDMLQGATPPKEGLAAPPRAAPRPAKPKQQTTRKGNPFLMPYPSRRAVPPVSESTLPPLEVLQKAPIAGTPVTQQAVPSKTISAFPVFGTLKYWKLLWKAIKYGFHDRFWMSEEELQRREEQREALRREKHDANHATSHPSYGPGWYGIEFDPNKCYPSVDRALYEQELAEQQQRIEFYNKTHPKLSEDEIQNLQAERDRIDETLRIGETLVEIAEIRNKGLSPGEAKWRAVKIPETIVIYRRPANEGAEEEEYREFKYAGYMVISSRTVTNREIRAYEGILDIRRGGFYHNYIFVGRYTELGNGNEQLLSEAIVLKKGQSYTHTTKESILHGEAFGQASFTHTAAVMGDYGRVLKSSLLTKYEPDNLWFAHLVDSLTKIG